MKKSFLLFLLFYFYITSSAGAALSVKMTLDRTSISLSDAAVLKVKIIGTRKSSSPIIAGLNFFRVETGGTSTNIQILNGKYSSTVTYTYYLYPEKNGKFILGPAGVKIDGNDYSSNRVNLTVSNSFDKKNNADQKQLLFVNASISKKDLYVNEYAVYTLKFYRAADVSELSLEVPEVDGIMIEPLTKPEKYSEVFNSKSYNIIEVKYAVSSKIAGKYTIPPAKFRMKVYRKRQFDNFFNDRLFNLQQGKYIYLSSNKLEINLKQLPADPPADFSGLVGEFEINSKIEPEKLNPGDSATLTLYINGAGNVLQIPDLILEDVGGLKIYQDKPVLETIKDDLMITGKKIMKWAIVPERGGEYKIPGFHISYFNPLKKKYITLKTESLILMVDSENKTDSGDIQNISMISKSVKKEVTQIGRDIFPVHTSVDPLEMIYSNRLYKNILIAGTILPPVVFLILFTGIKIKQRTRKNGFTAKSRNALKVFLKKIRDHEITPEDMHNAINEYLNNRMLLGGGVITLSEAETILADRGVSGSTTEKLQKIMQLLESAVFAGEIINNIKQIQKKLIKIIKMIEGEIK